MGITLRGADLAEVVLGGAGAAGRGGAGRGKAGFPVPLGMDWSFKWYTQEDVVVLGSYLRDNDIVGFSTGLAGLGHHSKWHGPYRNLVPSDCALGMVKGSGLADYKMMPPIK